MKVFLDSSVWFAAAFSPSGGSNEVTRRLAAGKITIIATKQVIAETVRNLQAKGNPLALERFFELYADVRPSMVEPKSLQIKKAEIVINHKDAPILAGAKLSECRYLVTLDRRPDQN
jgi:predicted nucleic acid-binding protein